MNKLEPTYLRYVYDSLNKGWYNRKNYKKKIDVISQVIESNLKDIIMIN